MDEVEVLRSLVVSDGHDDRRGSMVWVLKDMTTNRLNATPKVIQLAVLSQMKPFPISSMWVRTLGRIWNLFFDLPMDRDAPLFKTIDATAFRDV